MSCPHIVRDFLMGGTVTALIAYVAKNVSPASGAFVDSIPIGVFITLLAVYLSGMTPDHLKSFARQDCIARGTHALFAIVVSIALGMGLAFWKSIGVGALAWAIAVGIWALIYFKLM